MYCNKIAQTTIGLLMLYFLFFNPATVFAVPSDSGKNFGPKEHVHRIPDVNFLRASGLSERVIRQAIGATGTKRIAVLLVNFQSAGSSTSGSSEMSSGEIKNVATLITRLREYYSEVSYNSLLLEPIYVYSVGATKTFAQGLDGTETPIKVSREMEYYGAGVAGSDTGLYYLFNEAITATGITKGSAYDCVVVVHAGYGEETTSDKSGDIWSQFITLSPSINGFAEGIVVPVKEWNNKDTLGVFCHEFGHQLGLPDLYNTDPVVGQVGNSVVGYWCLMDMGPWLGNPIGSKPPHPSVWCKKLLGWLTPAGATGINTLTVNNVEQNKLNSSYKLEILNSPSEYFLLEYRKKILYDEGLPGEGVLIWHIDDTVGTMNSNNINVDPEHPRVKLVEADNDNNLTDTPTNRSDWGKSTDTFKNKNDMFNAPQSNSYVGDASGITLTNFKDAGNSYMTLDMYVLSSTKDLQVTKVFGFPSPAKDNVPIRIRAVFTRPISTGNIKIYTISGELVKESDIQGTNLMISASKDYEWVYEYVWDLTNSYGSNISSGVYLYVIETSISETDRQVKVGKVSVIR